MSLPRTTLDAPHIPLDPEPPMGSLVAVPGCAAYGRIRDGLWWSPTAVTGRAWSEVWTSDLRILRWGWGES